MAGGSREDVDGGSIMPSCPSMPNGGLRGGPCVACNCSRANWDDWVNNATIERYYGWTFPGDAQLLGRLYGNDNAIPPGSKWYAAAQHAVADWFTFCPSRRLCRSANAHTPRRTFLYLFTCPLGADAECPHCIEMDYFWGVAAKPTDKELADISAAYLVNFAFTGDPNTGPNVVRVPWPLYDNTTDTALDLGATVLPRVGLKAEQCDFWDARTVPIVV